MERKRIEKAVEIIDYAIKNQISVKEASKQCGMADTYVKNVKALVYELYSEGELDKELFQLFDEAYKLYVENKGFGYKEDQITETKKPSDIPSDTSNEKTEFSVNGNTATIEWKSGSNYPADHIRTLKQLLKLAEVDQNLWDVAQYTVNKWDVTAVIDKMPRTFQNFQVKARLDKKLAVVKERAIGEMFLDMVKNYKAPVLEINPKISSVEGKESSNLFEVTIFDLHLGKLAWGGETGENYDTKIARERFLTTIKTLIKNASGFQYNRILFPIGSDFFNSDTIFNTTTKGTPQDEDLRWQKTFNVGVRLLIDAISLLKQTGVPIDVVNIPGNHDFERSFYLGSYLEAWFNHDSQVRINNGASPRKYYRFGKVLLGLTHGSEEKEGSLPLLMASDIESKPMWSDTVYHEWHVGHIHRKRDVKYVVLDKSRMTNEDLGVTVRYLSSLTGTEEWHHKKGFIGCIKAGEGFIWNDEAGLVAHLNANLIID
jgi:hypothetical protein